jgi:hypothetical protein
MPNRTHGTKAAMIAAIKEIDSSADAGRIADAVLELLHRQRVITLRTEGGELLTQLGRVMCDLLEHPDATLRQVSMRTGMTENNVRYLMTRLVSAELGVRTRVGHRYHYSINPQKVLAHRDSIAFLGAVVALAEMLTKQDRDITPQETE